MIIYRLLLLVAHQVSLFLMRQISANKFLCRFILPMMLVMQKCQRYLLIHDLWSLQTIVHLLRFLVSRVIFKLVLLVQIFNFDQDGTNNSSPIYSWYVGEDSNSPATCCTAVTRINMFRVQPILEKILSVRASFTDDG